MCGLGIKVKRGLKNPGKSFSRTFDRIDNLVGKKLYGNTAGLKHNILKTGNIDKEIDPDLETKNPTLYHLKKDQFAMVEFKYDPSLIKRIKSKHDKMIEDDTYSIVTSGIGNSAYGRFLRLPVKDIPELAELITDKICEIVQGYFNSNFMIKSISLGRNYHVPKQVNDKDEVFSSHWHSDYRDIDELKLQIYMSDVTELDGGMRIISVERTKQLLKKGFRNRADYNLPTEILEDPNYVKEITGPIGTAYFSNNNLVLHRAGIPSLGHTRDRVTIVFVPSKKPLEKNWVDSFVPHMNREYKLSTKNSN